MKVVVNGGMGFIGRPLCASLCQEGYQVTLFTRRKEETQRSCGSTVTIVEWMAGKREPGSTVSMVPMPSSISPVRRLSMGAGTMPASDS